jgi:hypothetical protein
MVSVEELLGRSTQIVEVLTAPEVSRRCKEEEVGGGQWPILRRNGAFSAREDGPVPIYRG